MANRDPALSSTCMCKLDLHTWYLSPRHIPLALFSKRVDNKTKCAIVKAMQKNLPSQVQIGKPERPRVYEDSTLESFVSSESWLFFPLLRVHPTFFGCASCEEWELNSSFLQLQNVVSGLKVVNDPAERSFKFGGDYTDIITTDEARRQNILQQVEAIHRKYPTASKQTFTSEKDC